MNPAKTEKDKKCSQISNYYNVDRKMPFLLTFFSSVVHCNFDSIEYRESHYIRNKRNF